MNYIDYFDGLTLVRCVCVCVRARGAEETGIRRVCIVM